MITNRGNQSLSIHTFASPLVDSPLRVFDVQYRNNRVDYVGPQAKFIISAEPNKALLYHVLGPNETLTVEHRHIADSFAFKEAGNYSCAALLEQIATSR